MSSTYPNGTILIVEDEVLYWTHYQRKLSPLGFRFETAICPKEARKVLKRTQPDLILLDLRFENESPDEGLDFLSQILEQNKNIKIIVVTAATERKTALEAVRRGASDFIEKGSVGFFDALQFRVQAVFERLQLERQIEAQREREIDRIGGYPYGAGQIIVGTSPSMRRVYHFLNRVAQIDQTVLIQGESGTGKELVAQALHYHSQRSKGPWIPINCAAIPAELIEAELFGHPRGVFTGATEDRKGAFEAADGGTILLDEIGEMPLPLQPVLLRVLQEKTIKRIGENQERTVNVRVVAATNRNLEQEVEKGNFREDLFFRLNAFSVKLPSLHERREDIPLLIHHLTNQLSQQYNLYKRFTAETIDRMVEHDWPGNIRELKDMIQRAIVFADGADISIQDLDFTPSAELTMFPIDSTGNPMPSAPKSETDVRPYKEIRCVLEAWYVGEVLKLTQGNQTRAALLLGIDRNTIRRILTRSEGLQL